MRHALVLLLLVACKTSHSAESDAHLEALQDAKVSDVEHAEAHEEVQTARLTVQQPTRVEVEDFAPAPDGGVTLRRRTIRILGVRETSTGIDRTFAARSDGWEGAETHAEAKADAKATSSSSMAPAGGCMLGLGFWGAIVLAGLCLAGGLYLRSRPKL